MNDVIYMREAFVTIDGVKVFRGYNKSWVNFDGVGQKYCAICDKPIIAGEEVSLLMNNYKLFPNVWVHDHHLDFTDAISGTEVEVIAQRNVIQMIIDKYGEFETQWNKRKIWGNI